MLQFGGVENLARYRYGAFSGLERLGSEGLGMILSHQPQDLFAEFAHARNSRYQFTVRSRPSSSVNRGDQRSIVRALCALRYCRRISLEASLRIFGLRWES